MMKIIFRALIVLCVALTACGPAHALEYSYNSTSGVYNVTAGTADMYHNKAFSEFYDMYDIDPASKIVDETNNGYITLNGHTCSFDVLLKLLFPSYYEYNVTQDPYAKLLSYEYNPYIVNESELKEIVALCDDAIQRGNESLSALSSMGRDSGVRPIISYLEFMKINEVTDMLLTRKYTAICALCTRNVSGYDLMAVNEAKSTMEKFEYDDSEAFLIYEESRIALYSYLVELRNREAHGIKIEKGNYESTKFTVPLDNYTVTFELRKFSQMSSDSFETAINNKTISNEVGSGKEYHIEPFNVTEFGIEDANSGTNYLDISIAQYTGPTKYKPTQPFSGYSAVKGNSKRLEAYGADKIQIDGHNGWLDNAYYTHQDNYPDRHAVTFALDTNTFVMINTDRLDYDKDVALLFETFHIDKK